MSSLPIIDIEKVSKQFRQGPRVIKAVDEISLKINKGDFLVVIGPSGSGKSTLLQLIGGLDRPNSGKIKVGDMDITKVSDTKVTSMRHRDVGFIFQNFNLIPTLTASQNVEVAIFKRSRHDHERAMKALEEVGLGNRANHLPSLLSGGEQQRVAIARALINQPKIILADEPTGNLDSKTGEEIMDILDKLNKDNGQTVVLITHSDYVKKYATNIVQIRDGRLTTK